MELHWSPIGNDDRGLCRTCGVNEARHMSGASKDDNWSCCQCYVRAGSPPASWHPDCMKTYGEIAGPAALADAEANEAKCQAALAKGIRSDSLRA